LFSRTKALSCRHGAPPLPALGTDYSNPPSSVVKATCIVRPSAPAALVSPSSGAKQAGTLFIRFARPGAPAPRVASAPAPSAVVFSPRPLGVPPNLGRRRGVPPNLVRQRGVPPKLPRRRGVPPDLGLRQGVPPDLVRWRGALCRRRVVLDPLSLEHPRCEDVAVSGLSRPDTETWPPSPSPTSLSSRPPQTSGSREKGREGLGAAARQMERVGTITYL
jgi:hypothetical protein